MNVQNILEKVHHYVSLEWRICEPMFIWTFHLKITQKIVYQIYCGYSVNTLYTTFNSILMRTNFKYSIKSITNLLNKSQNISFWPPTFRSWLAYEDYDPYGQLAWLVQVLLKAEEDGEYVHILYHVPTDNDCLGTWAREFKRIISR